ncbi:MAG TPA: enolase C-terminal domain-like protein [Solirubrobacterales bacterium]|nr:enolase C-terminal domain-like protein [Solirubrobacterales bacterium]
MAVATRQRAAIEAPVTEVRIRAFTVPTDEPESDGTLEWDATTIVVVELEAEGECGLGYAYGDRSVATFVDSILRPCLYGADAMRPAAANAAMRRAIRNAGQQGVGAMAVSAADIALWDLKARLLGLPLADVLPRVHDAAPVYGSGGFTSYSEARLRGQLEGWRAADLPRAKIKVGRDPERDPQRLALCREVLGEEVELMVDANGAFAPSEALGRAAEYAAFGVAYLEEPVSSRDRAGLRAVRDRAPAGMAIAAGEYEWDLAGLGELAGCVDVVQADVTRIGGITAMLRADGLCRALQRPFSAHCAPAISAHVCCAIESLVHLEYFHDHVRLERMLFDGTLDPEGGALRPDPARPGHGLALKPEAERWRTASNFPPAGGEI